MRFALLSLMLFQAYRPGVVPRSPTATADCYSVRVVVLSVQPGTPPQYKVVEFVEPTYTFAAAAFRMGVIQREGFTVSPPPDYRGFDFYPLHMVQRVSLKPCQP